jgi:hypothetical protein
MTAVPSSFAVLVLFQSITCIRLHTSAYVSIRQHTSAYGSIRQELRGACPVAILYLHTSAYVSIRQHTSAYVSTLLNDAPRTSRCLSCCNPLPACVSIRQHTSAYVSIHQQLRGAGHVPIVDPKPYFSELS